MIRLAKLLSEESKIKRSRQNIINIQITILAWLVEFLGYCTVIFGSYIFGHTNSTVTAGLQFFTMIIYFHVLPCIFLIKLNIVESNWYVAFINLLGCGFTNTKKETTDEEHINVEKGLGEDNGIKSELESNVSNRADADGKGT